MANLDIFSTPEVQEEIQETPVLDQPLDFFNFTPEEPTIEPIEDSEDLVLNIKEKPAEPCGAKMSTNPVYFGKSFEYAGMWTPGKLYYNDTHRVTFVVYNNYLLACNLTHEASKETEPVILYDDGVAVGVENIYWQLVLSGEVGKDAAEIQSAIATLKRLVYNNINSLDTNNKAIETIGKHTNTLLDHVDRIEEKNKETDKTIAEIKTIIAANVAYPWIGSEDEYDQIIEKDPNKFYFVYEE